MTINGILPRSGHAGGLARAVPTLHHNRDTRGLRRAPVRQCRFLAASDHGHDPRAPPPRGRLRGDAASNASKEKNSIARKFAILFSNSIDATPRRVASRIFLMSDKIVVGSSGCDSVTAGLRARTPTARDGSA